MKFSLDFNNKVCEVLVVVVMVDVNMMVGSFCCDGCLGAKIVQILSSVIAPRSKSYLTHFSTPSPGRNGRQPSNGIDGGPGGNLLGLRNIFNKYLKRNINKTVHSISVKLILLCCQLRDKQHFLSLSEYLEIQTIQNKTGYSIIGYKYYNFQTCIA